ncbi:MAG: stage III sporulation protein AC [Lachnospiraceae bacterium]|nr:stage III sporulation protein AC [Lachnospiraceae bacterium]
MEVSILLKMTAVGILISLLSQILKHSGRDEVAFLLQLLGLVLVVGWVIPYVLEIFNQFSGLLRI